MSLIELVQNERTDKNTTHSYLELYETLLSSRKDATNVLEIGVCYGGSIKLWYDYFPNATVYGLDIIKIEDVWSGLNLPRIKIYAETNAYDHKVIAQLPKFDFMLDDGPHSLDSMVFFVKHYSKLLNEGGILIVEDVQDIEWFEILEFSTPTELKPFIKTYDLRKNKGRYDDLVFTINLSSLSNAVRDKEDKE